MPTTPLGVCVETPAHESFTSVCSGGFITSPPQPIEDDTVATASDIDALIYEMNANADAAAAEALAKIEALYNLSPPALPGINYEAPTWITPPLYSPLVPDLSLTDAPTATNNVVWSNPTLNDVTAPDNSITAPTTDLPDVPEPPVLDGVSAEPPRTPAEYEPGTLTAPEYVAPELTLGEIDTPDLEEITISIPDPITFDPLDYTIDFSAIEDAIDRASNISVPTSDIPDYEKLIPEVFTVVGSMVSGNDPINNDFILLDDADARKVVPMLERRGQYVPDHVYSFDDWLQTTMEEYAEDSATLFAAQHRDDVIKAAFSLAAAAEEILVNIDLGLYDARFQYSLEYARAQLIRAKGIVAAYNAEVVRLSGYVVEYNASLIALRAQADAVLIQAEVAELMGGANKLVARQFTIEEEAKKGDVRVFRAQVAGEAAKLTAQKALIDTIDVKLAQAQADMLGYTSKTTQYEAEIQKVKDVYAAYVAKSQAVVEENQMTRAQVRGGAANLKGIAAQARSSAASAAAEALRKVRVAKSNEAFYVSDGAANDIARYEIANARQEFAQDATQVRINANVDGTEASSIAKLGEAVSRFTRIALESSGRAASMAQRANESLIRAYAAAYEAAGRAGAAVASGKLSGFRASASMSAAGSLNANRVKAESYSSSGSTSYSENDTASESVTV